MRNVRAFHLSTIFNHIALLLMLVLLNACGGGGGTDNSESNPPASPIGDISGAWQVTGTDSSSTPECDGVGFVLTATIVQSGNNLTVTGFYPSTLSGTISGNQMTFSGSYPEDGGTTTLNSSTSTVTVDCNQFTGNDSWSWTDGTFSCSGTSTYTGTRLTGSSCGVTVPSVPQNIHAALADSQVTVSWNSVSGATSYNIYWNTTGGVSTSDNQITNTTPSYVHSGLTNGAAYYYIVTAVNAAGESVPSSEVSATPQVPVEPPSAPQNIQTVSGDGQVTLSWDSVSNVSSYNIYWSNTYGVTTSDNRVTDVTSPFDHTDRINDTTYYYMVTAVNAAGESVASNEVFATPSIEGDYWITKTSMPTARNAATSNVVNGKIYVIGGAGSSGYLSTTEEYDPITDTWTTKSPMPTARSYSSSSVVGGKIYVIGGAGNSGYLTTVEEYDPTIDIWTTKTSMPTARNALVSNVVNGKIYALGGRSGVGQYLYNVEEYDPATDSWIIKPNMPTNRQGPISGVVNGKIYVMAGFNFLFLTSVDEYDPVTSIWSTKSPMAIGRHAATSSMVNGKIYAIGGEITGGSSINTVEEYDPANNSWITKTPMPTARKYMTSSKVNGKIYVFGGIDGVATINIVEEYNPNSNP